MFPNDAEVAESILAFLVLGATFGVPYEILRFFRHLIPAGRIRVSVEDTLFMLLASAVMFVTVLSSGGGQLRLYHVIAALLGFSIYIATLGRLVNFLNKRVGGLIRKSAVKVFSPVCKALVKMLQIFLGKVSYLYKMFTISIKKAVPHLKKDIDLVYNDNAYNSNLKRSELRNVIKAKIK